MGVEILARFMRETGIRLLDALELRPEHIHDREIFTVEGKRALRLYEYDKGKKPVISPETADLLVPGEDGKYFHITAEQFRFALRKASKKQDLGKGECIKAYDFRRYFVERKALKLVG